jgi:cobalt/nickel transport system ATP-binding protein
MEIRNSLPVFLLDNVNYEYQSVVALRNINLKILHGEKIVILGANGSGKSTLLKILDALDFPTQGTFTAFGQNITGDYFNNENNEFEFRRKVGYVFQDSDVQLFSPTVWDEITFAPLHMELPLREVVKMASHAMKIMDIGHLKDRVPHQLSGGEKKRVAIASILSYQPSVWLFDEPTAGLDPKSQCRLIDFIYEIHGQKNTVITATHDLSILDEIADRVIVLSENHKIVADDSPKNILSNLKLLRKYNLIHEHRHRHKNRQHSHQHTHNLRHGHTY